MLNAAQIRAARALLGWPQEALAKAANVGLATIRRIEKESGQVRGNVSTVNKIEEAFERAGVRFTDADDNGGPGVRLSKSPSRKRR